MYCYLIWCDLLYAILCHLPVCTHLNFERRRVAFIHFLSFSISTIENIYSSFISFSHSFFLLCVVHSFIHSWKGDREYRSTFKVVDIIGKYIDYSEMRISYFTTNFWSQILMLCPSYKDIYSLDLRKDTYAPMYMLIIQVFFKWKYEESNGKLCLAAQGNTFS